GITAADPSSGPSLVTAPQDELRLKLESSKGPVEEIVIDTLEKPSGKLMPPAERSRGSLLYPPAGLDGLVVARFKSPRHHILLRFAFLSACLPALLLDPKESSL